MPHGKEPRVYVFLGLIASGKSTLAERFAGDYALPYYNTDRVRKELAGIDARQLKPDQYNQGIYTREFSQKTYQEMLDRTVSDIRAGSNGVVLDGSYHSREERDRVRRLGVSESVGVVFIHCLCSDDEVKRRLAQRARDPHAVSDGRWEIFLVQKDAFQVPEELAETELVTLNTEQPVSELLKRLTRKLNMEPGQ